MNHRLKVVILLITLFAANCGKRESSEEFVNYLDGTWRVEQINCYLDSSTPVEYYVLSKEIDIIFKFESRSVTYTVTPDCGISTKGNYTMGHTSYTSGYANLLNLLGGGTCIIDESEENGAGKTDISLEVTSSFSGDLLWRWDKNLNRLHLTFPTSFKGSTNVNFCDEECTCVAEMSPN